MYPVLCDKEMIVCVGKFNFKVDLDDIIVYKKNKKYIVHRVVEICKKGNHIFYRTKGDNNKLGDDYYVFEGEIIGKIVICERQNIFIQKVERDKNEQVI